MLKNLLQKPFPFSNDFKKEIRILIAVSLFPGLFFLLFKPFGILGENQNWRLYFAIMGFGLATGFMAAIFSFILPLIFKKFYQNFTVGKALIHYSLMILSIAVGNYLYKSSLQGFQGLSWQEFLLVLERTLLIAIIPTVGIIIWYQNYLLKNHLRVAQEINEKLSRSNSHSELIISSENEKEILKLKPEQLLYIENQDNYVMVYFYLQNVLEKKLIRSSLQKIETDIEETSIVRCHRSYIVNLTKVKHVKGNSKGLQLELLYTDTIVPVSRTYLKNIKEKLNVTS